MFPRSRLSTYARATLWKTCCPRLGSSRISVSWGGPLRSDLKVAMIATQDIGAAAAEALLKLEFTGKQARELLGQRDLTYQEVASVIGQAIGKPGLAYMQLPSAQLKPALVQMGMSANMADLILEMAEALNSGYMAALEPRSAAEHHPDLDRDVCGPATCAPIHGKSRRRIVVKV